MRARFILATTAVALAVGALPAVGQAQSNPTSDQIVKSLTPTEKGVSGATRGIRIGSPSPQAGKAGPAATQVAPAVSLSVEFMTGSADLTPAAQHSLDQLGKALNNPTLASYHFRIEGHTDTVGTKEMNQDLSERRANTVVGYLTSKYQVDVSRLQAVGMGENGLLVQTPDQTAEPRNRRVVVVNTGG